MLAFLITAEWPRGLSAKWLVHFGICAFHFCWILNVSLGKQLLWQQKWDRRQAELNACIERYSIKGIKPFYLSHKLMCSILRMIFYIPLRCRSGEGRQNRSSVTFDLNLVHVFCHNQIDNSKLSILSEYALQWMCIIISVMAKKILLTMIKNSVCTEAFTLL